MKRERLITSRGTLGFVVSIFCAALIMLCLVVAFCPKAYAEGTRDLVTNGGYRPYTERYNSATLGQNRLSVMHVYLEKGETVYLGTSVADAKLYEIADNKNSGWLFSNDAMGKSYSDAQLAYVNTADIYITQGEYGNIADAIAAGKTPGTNGVTLIDLDDKASKTTPGYIYDSAQEAGGVDLTGSGSGYKVTSVNTISSSTAGYVAGVKTNANTYTAPSTGIYTVVFFSQKHSGENPVKCKVTDTTSFKTTQKGGTIASWDISVYSGSTLQTGRVFTNALFINMGGNVLSGGVSQGSLYSDIYAVTDDGYQYQVDFNGMDPFGFVFFANNRGLLRTDATANTSSSLYHGLRSDNNTLSDVTGHGIALNNTPYDSALDKTYNLFYEKPSTAALKALGIPDPVTGAGSISDFKFTGTGDDTKNQGYVGEGGTFSFTASSDISATSYQIELDFSSIGGGTVVLSNTLNKGKTNSIAWDGKDANGKVVPAGTYSTLKASIKLKGGEVHFPLLDVEQNPYGVKITRLNGTDPDSVVYFNNSSSNAGDTTAPWTLAKNWEVGNQTDATAGVDSSSGAMAFTNTYTKNKSKGMTLLGDGDQSALDLWAYYNTTAALGDWSFTLVDASFTVTKTWVRTGQTVANPVNVTMTLRESTDGGTTWNNVTTDDSGALIANPVTYDTSNGATYTWTKLDPAYKYQVVESDIVGYDTLYGDIGKVTDPDTGNIVYSQEVTNTYDPTTLKLTKVWNMNGSDEPIPGSVTLTVYTDANKTNKLGDYTLDATDVDANGNWTVTIDPVDPTLTYYVYETAVDGYATIGAAEEVYTISGQGKANGNGDDGFTDTVTDSFNKGKFMSVAVLKYWTDGDTYLAYRPDSIFVTLYKDGVKITQDATGQKILNPVPLDDANSWYYVWPALVTAGTSDTGYTITETDEKGNTLVGYTATVDNLNFLNNFGYGAFENAYDTTTFTVNKTWNNGVNTDQPTAVTVQLQQSTDGGTSYADYGAAQTLTKDTDWTYKWSNLPTYTKDSTQILYRATETAVSGYATTAGDVDGTAATGYTQTITNTYDYTSLTVNKIWDHGTQLPKNYPSSAMVALYGNGALIDTCALNDDDAWSHTFNNLPAYNADGMAISYTVVEDAIPGYTISGGTVAGTAATGYSATFTNTYKPTTFTVTKIWDHGVQDKAYWPSSTTFQLYADGTAYGEPVTLTAANTDDNGNWTYTWTGLDSVLDYTIVETPVDGYSTSGGVITGSADAGFGATFTNTCTYTKFTVTKVWNHGTQAQSSWPTSVTFQLYKDGTALGDPVNLTSANADESGNWVYTWQNLEPGAGYTVTETAVAGYTFSGGTTTFNSDGSYSTTFTNTYTTGTSTNKSSTSKLSKTGDTGALVLIPVFAVVLIAGAALIVAGKRRRL